MSDLTKDESKPPCSCCTLVNGRWTWDCSCSNFDDYAYAVSFCSSENDAITYKARIAALEQQLRSSHAAYNSMLDKAAELERKLNSSASPEPQREPFAWTRLSHAGGTIFYEGVEHPRGAGWEPLFKGFRSSEAKKQLPPIKVSGDASDLSINPSCWTALDVGGHSSAVLVVTTFEDGSLAEHGQKIIDALVKLGSSPEAKGEHPDGWILSVLEEAQQRAESDLMAVGHGRDGEARTAAMLDLKNWGEKLQEAINEERRRKIWHCNICGGEIDLRSFTRPTEKIGPGGDRLPRETGEKQFCPDCWPQNCSCASKNTGDGRE